MDINEKHLCIAIDRYTKEQLSEDMIIEAIDWYYARHIAANKFRDMCPDCRHDWCIDSMKLDT